MIISPLCSVKFNNTTDTVNKVVDNTEDLKGRILYIRPLFVNQFNCTTPPINNNLRTMISKSYRDGKLENFVNGWTKIIAVKIYF